jgi:hypothetical protein
MPVSPEEEWTYWDTKATELRRGQLATVQAAAARWAALLTGIGALSMAAGGLFVSRQHGISATTVQELYTTQMGTALHWLNVGRSFAVAAAALVLAGSLIVLWVPEKSEPAHETTVLAVIEGRAICGPLGRAGGTLTVGGTPVAAATSLAVVTKCP